VVFGRRLPACANRLHGAGNITIKNKKIKGDV